MKVCYLTPEYPPARSGGIGTSIATRSRALVAAGHEVVVVGPGPRRHEVDHGVDVRIAPVAHPPRLGWAVVPIVLQRRLRRLVAEEGVDVVVAPDWIGISGGVRPGCPVVVECNGSASYFADELDEHLRTTVRRSERRALRGADVVLSVSSYVGERTRAIFDLAVPVATVPNGVDLARFPVADPAARDSSLVLHVGTLVRKKGVLDLLAAFAGIAAVRADARLLAVGPDAPDRSSGRASTWQLALEAVDGPTVERTRWAGPVAHDEVVDAYRRATLVLVPSYAEAQPMVWLEAMATGLPVVAYDRPWAREVVVDGETGLLVPPGDVAALTRATLALLEDRDRREAMGRAAVARVREHFAIDVVREQLVHQLEAAGAGRPATVRS